MSFQGVIELSREDTISLKELEQMNDLELIMTRISEHHDSNDILAITNWIQLPKAFGDGSIDHLRYKVRYVSTNCTWERFFACDVKYSKYVNECIATFDLRYNRSVDLQFIYETTTKMVY